MSLHLTLVLKERNLKIVKNLKIVVESINVVTSHSERSSLLDRKRRYKRKSPNIPHTETVDFVWGFNVETRLIAAETQSDFGRKHPGR
ncbi:hypothetical protein [Frog virus 3]|uniref:Surface protein n=2 Tax=Ranavirus TaxID=10492 RepID=A0A2U7M3M2_FRG3V|nr:hypothetical protein [Andrias davidianus ranavirus]API65297.1 hypothetical protein FV3_ORF92 [Frog virus 3]API65322.1 hypothetical protein RCV-Z_ORF14.5 [Rana catesbeiana virus]ASU44142.1 hypothetical protein RCV-Z2_ORF14 [Rana catesbeiana virus 2]ASU44245.1 hypothetical protein RCV-Z_ORF16 [Rana catesbeiana virus]